jgi:hypothetical protein
MEPDDPELDSRQEQLELVRSLVGTAPVSVTTEGEKKELVEIEDGPSLSMNLTGIDFIDKGIVKKWRENPGLMLYKMQANGYKFSWLLIPLSIPFVWVIFLWRRKFKAYDHAIFVTYSLSFMSLLFITLSLLNAAGLELGWTVLFFAIAAPLHIYKHMKYSYGLSRFSTLWRFFALLAFILLVLVLFLQALILLGGF